MRTRRVMVTKDRLTLNHTTKYVPSHQYERSDADRLKTPITNMIIESYQSQGLPLVPDMFATGDTSSGCGHVNRTVYRGDRTTAANYFRNKGSNLTIQTDTTVDKIVFKGEKQTLRAAGVDVIMKDGTTKYYTAREEIVVSSGSYCSPVILKRSGIGPKDELAAHGIPCKVDLPGVGQNLMDHAVRLHLCSHRLC